MSVRNGPAFSRLAVPQVYLFARGRLGRIPRSWSHEAERMTQVPPTSRSILLPGVLAGAVVLVLGLLALGPRQPAADSPTPERPTSTSHLAGEPSSPALGRHGSLPPGQAWRHNHATHRGVDLRHAQPGIFLVPRGGTPRTELPDWLAHFRGRRPPSAHPPLHVLFCTWLA
jgi:hypothetical protein